MVFYYDQNQPMAFALTIGKTMTIFKMVCTRLEFWFFFALHCTGVVLFRLGILNTGEFGKFRWEAVSATQMFMVFCLTFFNGHCFTRYLYLYDICMKVLDGTLFFVQELVVSMASPKVENHRIRSVKYVICMLHIFFLGIAGGMKTKQDWREIVKRGLLTKAEAEQLQLYPARSIEQVLVLAAWAMQIVDKALEDDVFWEGRSMRIAHTHNRLQDHMNDILRAIHEIGDVLALPIPFPYYHVMNVVLIFNLLVLSVITASFATYQTVFPVVVSLMFFLGLREVSGSLADPFNGEDSDFPIETFLQYAFDTAVCLLEAFREGSVEEFVCRQLAKTTEFTNEQVRHVLPSDILYNKAYDPVATSPFSWNKEMPLSTMAGTAKGPLHALKTKHMTLAKDEAEIRNPRLHDDLESVEIEMPKPKRGLCARCCPCCCRAKRAQPPPEEHISISRNLLRAQQTLENEKETTAHLEGSINMLKKKVEIQQQKIEHRLKIGREMGLPVDEFMASFKGRKLKPDQRNPRRRPEFTSFAEAREIIANNTSM